MSKPTTRDGVTNSVEPKARQRAPTLHELQANFQQGIMSGDPKVLDLLCDNSRTTRNVLFGVYQHAYVGRLVDILKNDHPLLLRYLGAETFSELAKRYIEAHPSRNQNARWFSHQFPDFLAKTNPQKLDIVELSCLERAVNDAFDAPDDRILEFADLSTTPPDRWGQLAFAPHPSACYLEFDSNAYDLWLSLKDDQPVPPSVLLQQREHILAWRRGTTPSARRLGTEEAMMWKEAAKGVRFGVLCEMLATYADPEGAPIRAASYLQGWIVSGLLTAFRLVACPQATVE